MPRQSTPSQLGAIVGTKHLAVDVHQRAPGTFGQFSAEGYPEDRATSLKSMPTQIRPHAEPSEIDSSKHPETILHALQSDSDFESSAILARIRLGDDWKSIAKDIIRDSTNHEQDSR